MHEALWPDKYVLPYLFIRILYKFIAKNALHLPTLVHCTIFLGAIIVEAQATEIHLLFF